MRFISARYDLTFPLDLTHDVIAEVRKHELPLDVVWLPCGHYTTAEMPWKATGRLEDRDVLSKTTLERVNSLECGDLSPLWPVATCRRQDAIDSILDCCVNR